MKWLLWRPLWWMALMVLSDQLIKIWIRLEVPLYRSTVWVPGFLELTHVENRGVSFSVMSTLSEAWRVPLLSGISLAVMAVLVVFWVKEKPQMNLWMEAGFMMVLAGATGNLIDRSIYGTVTDYWHFLLAGKSLFVNNLADVYISAGVVAYAWGGWLAHRQQMAEQAAQKAGSTPPEDPPA